MQMQAAAVLALAICCLVGMAAAGNCNANGPQVSLKELNSECKSSKMSRSDGCVSAMHEFCQKVTYGENEMHEETFGISQRHESGRIYMSCVKSDWSGMVSVPQLQEYDKECTVEEGSQGRHCLAAIHRFCKNKLDSDSAAGISQKVNDGFYQFYVQCFRSPHKERILHGVLNDKKYRGSCGPFRSSRSHTDDCFEAASDWCKEKSHIGSNGGGITQEVDDDGVVVACYKAEFSTWAHIIRSADYYTDENEVVQVCDLNFDISSGKIVGKIPQLIQSEYYDNKKAQSTTLEHTFTVSKTITEKSSFTISSSYTISASATTNLNVKLPQLDAGGSVTVSGTYTELTSLTEEVLSTTTRSKSSIIKVGPGTAVTVKAIGYKGRLEVPWSATAITALGHRTTIRGMWGGFDTYDLKIEEIEGVVVDSEVCSIPTSLEKEVAQLLSFVARK